MVTEPYMDWTGCDLVEKDPEKVSGRPVVKGTRVPADVVIVDEEHGRTPEQTHASLPKPEPSHNQGFARLRPSASVATVKVLLDENIPHDLRPCLVHHQTFTAAYLGWAGLKNGALLEAADKAAFDVW